MAHVARNAAERLVRYLNSGSDASRSFKARKGHLKRAKTLHPPSYYRYHYPPMNKRQFHRISRIPGVRAHMVRSENEKTPVFPWQYLGARHAQLHKDQNHPEEFPGGSNNFLDDVVSHISPKGELK